MVATFGRAGPFLLLAAAAAIAVWAIPHHADAGEYWVLGMPDEGATGPPNVSTAVAVTNLGTAADTPILMKVNAGTATPVATTSVAPGATGILTFTDYLEGTQISNTGVYFVSTVQPFAVAQLTTANGAVAAAGSNADATRAMELGRLGTSYRVLTHYGVSCLLCIPPTNDFFTVIATKAGTLVTVTPSVNTVGSTGCPLAPCAVPGEVPPMIGGTTRTFALARGQALHVVADHILAPDCPLCTGNYDLSGTRITATAPVAVFAGTGCTNMNDQGGGSGGGDTSCDTLNDEMIPDSSAGRTFVLCAGAMSATPAQIAAGMFVSQVDRIRVMAVSGTATLTFAVPVAASYSGVATSAFATITPPPTLAATTTTATVTSTAWSQWFFNRDTVITSTAPIIVEDYISWSDVRSQNAGNTASLGWVENYNPVVRFTWGDPSQVSVTGLDRAVGDNWMYGFPGWENHMYIGALLGTVISDNGVVLPASATRSIGTSGYGCTTPADLAPAGVTHHIATSNPASVQMLGLGASSSYWYDSGPFPSPIPPVVGPTAAFKWGAKTDGCGDSPVTFTDSSVPGSSPIIAWAWDFGDGSSSTDPSPSHVYASPGSYDVSLTVTDANGKTSTSTVTITAIALPPCVVPTKSEDNAFGPRPPRDGVDDALAGSDIDGDGIANAVDNCPTISNADQSDLDGDFAGDACDTDVDGDGIVNASDNCPKQVNVGQLDLDGDGQGDVCDDDIDGDTIANAADNCPMTGNKNQLDANTDLVGDACEERMVASVAPEASRPLNVAASDVAPAATPSNALAGVLPAVVGLVLVSVALVLLAALRRRK